MNVAKGVLIVVGLIIALAALDFLLVAGIVKLIALCFELTFSWKITTGVWLVLMLIHGAFYKGRN